jgi:hypothetical protein
VEAGAKDFGGSSEIDRSRSPQEQIDGETTFGVRPFRTAMGEQLGVVATGEQEAA